MSIHTPVVAVDIPTTAVQKVDCVVRYEHLRVLTCATPPPTAVFIVLVSYEYTAVAGREPPRQTGRQAGRKAGRRAALLEKTLQQV